MVVNGYFVYNYVHNVHKQYAEIVVTHMTEKEVVVDVAKLFHDAENDGSLVDSFI